MTELTATYSEEEVGWVTDAVSLSCDTYLVVTLNKMGYVVIKQLDETEGTKPKVSVSGLCKEIRVHIETKEKRTIYVLTSEEPNKIEYVNIRE